MKLFCTLYFVSFISNVKSHQELDVRLAEDATLETPKLAQKYGYPAETHSLVTSDGYVLEMHRIPHGITSFKNTTRPAVFLQHGLLCSSADWLLVGPHKGLAYLLADFGYDVWMGNARGNTYSRKHVSLDPSCDSKTFWDFSWHEIAVNDVTAMIDYIVETTHQEKIFYIGHSQGTTTFFVMASEKPEYNSKIEAAILLAPVVYSKHMTSPVLKFISNFHGPFGALGKIIGMHEFLPQSRLLAEAANILCLDNPLLQTICSNALFAFCGFNCKQFNATLLPIIAGHTPAGASTKQVLHYAQMVTSGKFRRWDYGFFKNIKVYGRSKPPSYDVKKITAPVYLYYSRNDWLSNEKDVLKLYGELKNVQTKVKFLVPDKMFNHLDYLYAIDAPSILYLRIISILKRYKHF